MARYAIGDIQGCYEGLSRLLERANFDPAVDSLYAVGDLIARGEDSLSTIRLLRSLANSFSTVLGNHDLHFLAVTQGIKQAKANDKIDTLLASAELPEIIQWYRQWPLAMVLDDDLLLVHAGLYPKWSFEQIIEYSDEISRCLKGPQWVALLNNMYGDGTAGWHPTLDGIKRQQFIINATTRMRFLTAKYALDLKTKCAPSQASPSLHPWFKLSNPHLSAKQRVIFGHWAALTGHTQSQQFIALDTGYVWGGQLTMIDLDSLQSISISPSNF